MKDSTLKIKTVSKERVSSEIMAKSAVSDSLIEKFVRVKEKISEIPITSLENQFNHLVKGMQAIFDNMVVNSDNYDVEEIKFTCTINNKGDVSILGMIEGGIEYQKGIEITLKKKK